MLRDLHDARIAVCISFLYKSDVSDWEGLWELAASQDGLFHVRDARGYGITSQALHLSKRVEQVEGYRGLHRFKHAAVGRWHAYTAAYVWSRDVGVISHGSALDAWGLSEWLPHRVEMTLPRSWKQRLIPTKVLAFYDDLPDDDIQWYENFRITTPRRSVDDFIAWGIRPDLARQAMEHATSRGRPGGALFHRRDLKHLHRLFS